MRPSADGSNAGDYQAALAEAFRAFPDEWNELRRMGLGYFAYSLTEAGQGADMSGMELDTAIERGLVRFDPIVYEDFLPVSAAGIFQSNLGDQAAQEFRASPSQKMFERDLGCPVLDEFAHYHRIELATIATCLGRAAPVPAHV